MATPGQILPLPTQIVLKLSADQKMAVAAIQKEVDGKVDALLDDDQKDQMKEIRGMMARGGRPGGPGGPRPGPGGPAAPAARPWARLAASAAMRSSGPTATRMTTPAWPARTSRPARRSRNSNASGRSSSTFCARSGGRSCAAARTGTLLHRPTCLIRMGASTSGSVGPASPRARLREMASQRSSTTHC